MKTNVRWPSLGFCILFTTVVICLVFLGWVNSPLSYERAANEEALGHREAAEGNRDLAFKHFLAAAEIDDDAISRGRRYRCAGTVSANKTERRRFFQLALTFDKNNLQAKVGLAALKLPLQYHSRFLDGWSQGNEGHVSIDVVDPNSRYFIEFFTGGQNNLDNSMSLSIDGDVVWSQDILPGKRYKELLKLTLGENKVSIAVKNTFNPKALGMSKDDRELGINFSVIELSEVTRE